MKNANDLSGYSISDLVKIVNDYEQQKTFLEEQEELITELKDKITALEKLLGGTQC